MLTIVPAVELDYDSYLVDQVIRPIANLYRVTPLAAGETPAGPPIAYVRQKKMAIKEEVRFYADEGETRELFRIKARSMFDIGGARYDVTADGDGKIGTLEHHFGRSLLRTTWIVRDGSEAEVATARERSATGGILRRAIDFVPDIGGLIPIPYNFEILSPEGERLGGMDRKFQLRTATSST
jgi:hypothetical protein